MTNVTTKERVAAFLDGRNYVEFEAKLKTVQKDAEESGLVIVYGASDDLMELRGALDNEYGCYDGGTFYLTKAGIMEQKDDICSQCDLYKNSLKQAHKLVAKWCKGEWCWSYEIDVPHSTFHLYEGKDKYCKGIVFELEALR